MGFLKNVKAMKDAMKAGYDGSGPSEEALASLTPEQRAAYDEQMAKVAAAQTQAAEAQATALATVADSVAKRPLRGPAGEFVYGSETQGVMLSEEQIASMSSAELMAWQTQQSKDQFKDLLKNPFGAKKTPPPPMAPVGPAPVDRSQQIDIERAARDAARRPYLAEHRPPVVFSRLATRSKTQIEEVTAYLASSGLAARPDLVYGLYRVPDHISPGSFRGDGGRVVEWDIVHAAPSGVAPSTTTPVAVWFDGGERWVDRRIGEPAVADEELALAYLAAAGVGPEQCLGIARSLAIRGVGGGDGESSYTFTRVTGAHVFHPPGAGAGVIDRMKQSRPLALPAGAPAGIHLVALNWRAVAKAVHPMNHRAYTIPSPFPYLPSSAQELIRMYLEIVGVCPEDAYTVGVTEDGVRNIEGVEQKAGGLMTLTTNSGDSLPCADGESRKRLAGGAVVVIAYRDCDQYAAGRERWASYQRDVLQSNLESQTGWNRPVEAPDLASVPSGLRKLIKAAEKVADFVDIDSSTSPLDDLAPHRYCWPPSK